MFGFDKYQYSSDETSTVYSFISNGPQGVIHKSAKFELIKDNVYNFGFGDFDPVTRDICHTTVSNNKDVDVIMGTVGAIIYDFTNTYPKSLIFIQGYNKARTRLYQINMNKHWELIKPIFKVLGLLNDEWEPIRKGVNYDSFLGYRKDF
jgi:hypothetical protein